MKFEYNIKFTDNTPQLHEALDSWAERVLTLWGMKVQDYAQLLVPTGTADSTGIEGYVGGALKASITYVVSAAQKTVTIGSNLFYSVYVELGTGIFAEKGNGRKTPWVWKDFNGKWHFTRGMKARPFLRPAVEDHIEELRQIAVEEGNKEA
jgi:HK97 gp10 family phage protein